MTTKMTNKHASLGDNSITIISEQ